MCATTPFTPFGYYHRGRDRDPDPAALTAVTSQAADQNRLSDNQLLRLQTGFARRIMSVVILLHVLCCKQRRWSKAHLRKQPCSMASLGRSAIGLSPELDSARGASSDRYQNHRRQLWPDFDLGCDQRIVRLALLVHLLVFSPVPAHHPAEAAAVGLGNSAPVRAGNGLPSPAPRSASSGRVGLLQNPAHSCSTVSPVSSNAAASCARTGESQRHHQHRQNEKNSFHVPTMKPIQPRKSALSGKLRPGLASTIGRTRFKLRWV